MSEGILTEVIECSAATVLPEALLAESGFDRRESGRQFVEVLEGTHDEFFGANPKAHGPRNAAGTGPQ